MLGCPAERPAQEIPLLSFGKKVCVVPEDLAPGPLRKKDPPNFGKPATQSRSLRLAPVLNFASSSRRRAARSPSLTNRRISVGARQRHPAPLIRPNRSSGSKSTPPKASPLHSSSSSSISHSTALADLPRRKLPRLGSSVAEAMLQV